jgi:hypothetical protein
MVATVEISNTIDGVEYPPFIGSPRQREWAHGLRQEVIKKKLYHNPSDLDLLRQINDSTWWIANRHQLRKGLPFKQPIANQLVNAANVEAELQLDLTKKDDGEGEDAVDAVAEKQGVIAQTFTRVILDGILEKLQHLSENSDMADHARDTLFLPFREKFKSRCILSLFAEAEKHASFVAVVEGRGFVGKLRTILLKDLRAFGIKFILEDHLWIPYSKKWERIEPFLQGQKVLLYGLPISYQREDNTVDYTIQIEKLVKL